jgi:hypothetical protein
MARLVLTTARVALPALLRRPQRGGGDDRLACRTRSRRRDGRCARRRSWTVGVTDSLPAGLAVALHPAVRVLDRGGVLVGTRPRRGTIRPLLPTWRPAASRPRLPPGGSHGLQSERFAARTRSVRTEETRAAWSSRSSAAP